MPTYTYDDVYAAYIKLKTYIYYDSTNLYMRKQLAVFETSLSDDDSYLQQLLEYKNFEKIYGVDTTDPELSVAQKKLLVFTRALNNYRKQPEYFDRFFERIKSKFLPKKIRDANADSKIITNKRTAEEYKISRFAVFIDVPIEIHLISVLWILKKGYLMDMDLFTGCLGNRLILNKEKTGVVQGSGLFKPYPRQYQKWRDDAVTIAREHLAKGENVSILNLDIRDFFYSVRIPVETFRDVKGNLFVLFEKIHALFTAQLSKDYKTPYDFSGEVYDGDKLSFYILPIGLLSSFILANHYLVPFDKRIIKKPKPVYYGRYVDDILMVIVNPVPPDDKESDVLPELNFNLDDYKNLIRGSEYHDSFETFTVTSMEDLSDLEQFVLKNFSPVITLIDKPSFLSAPGSSTFVFKLNGFKRLYCQSDKTLLYYFDKDESSLVIDKLKRDLEEKSSEFRNYSDEEDEEDFEESAYHLLYDGTDGKIRTLKDYKEDRFGLSVYLSKKIFNTLRRADKMSGQEAEKIVRFFQGCNALNLTTLWERVFVLFLVNKKPLSYVQFYFNCREAIKRTRTDPGFEVTTNKYQMDILEYLECANELALSLHPKFLSETRLIKRTYEFSFRASLSDSPFYEERYQPTSESSFYINRFRKSNLVRHHYAAQPLLTYTEDQKGYTNFTDLTLHF